jgi:hypothetical protein
MPGDLLRLGYEDDSWHCTYRIPKYIPKRGRIYIKLSSARKPRQGAPVFLTDRREKWLEEKLSGLEDMLTKIPETDVASSTFNAKLPGGYIAKKRDKFFELHVYRKSGMGDQKGTTGAWMFPEGKYKPLKARIFYGCRKTALCHWELLSPATGRSAYHASFPISLKQTLPLPAQRGNIAG